MRPTDVVKQGGTRRGANMGILRVDHPTSWSSSPAGRPDPGDELQHFGGGDGRLHEGGGGGDELRPDPPPHRRRRGPARRPRGVSEVVHGAWKTGEPGVYFNRSGELLQPRAAARQLRGDQPCGEQPLLPYDVCNLGSINVGPVREGPATSDWIVCGRRYTCAPTSSTTSSTRTSIRSPKSMTSPSASAASASGHGLGGPAGAPRPPVRLGRRRPPWAAG